MSYSLEKFKNQPKTIYQQIANKFGLPNTEYVGKIARGERVPVRKNSIGYKILEELKKRSDELEGNNQNE